MGFVYTPGNIQVDDSSDFGTRVHLLNGQAPDLPDPTAWQKSIRQWLDAIKGTDVGRILLNAIQERPPASRNVVVKIVRMPRDTHEAKTDGILPGRSANNPGAEPTIFITFTPPDSRGQKIDPDPMRHPGSVLVHELMHAFMAIQGLNARLDSRGQVRPIAVWTSTAYPDHKEFCATTLQNMMLSQTGSMLADGYTQDDPHIFTTLPAATTPTAFGTAATTSYNARDFVAAYRMPLDFLVNALPSFCNALAAKTQIPFNPFAAMRGTGASGTTPARGGASGAARVPRPVDISPHD